MRKKGLTPAPLADRRTLVRRVYLDLIGLPPAPEAVEAFVRDPDPKAYEKLVDRLLADPGYGERWGRHWLDVVRFGESQGFERDHLRPNSWPYRDYVIRAFNDDKPYDQFIREQLAGDVLKPETRDGIAATGFLSCGPWDEVGHESVSPMVKKRARDEELEDIIGTVSQTFLGLTANCARCHDHKFDPIPTRDYYRLRAALEGALPGERTILTAEDQVRRAQDIEEQRRRIAQAEAKVFEIEEIGRKRVREKSGRDNAAAGQPAFSRRWSFDPGSGYADGLQGGKTFGQAKAVRGKLELPGSGSFYSVDPGLPTVREKTLEVWVTLSTLDQRAGAAITLQNAEGNQFDAIVFGERQPRKWSAGSELFKRTKDLDAPEETVVGKPIHIAITYGADNRIAVYRNGQPYGTPYVPTSPDGTLRAFTSGKQTVLIGLRHIGSSGYLSGEVDEARIYEKALSPEEVRASFLNGPAALDPAVIRAALSPEERAELDARAARRDAEARALRELELPQLVYAIKSTTPLPTYVLVRGDPENPGELVTAGGLSCCKTLPAEVGAQVNTPEGVRRLGLANWIADRRNPLTARVMVNRIWHYHFGRGLVGSPNDFGFNGDRPTHPELLDWLASRFMEGDTSSGERRAAGGKEWSVKGIQRLILLSETYRRSSRYDVKAAAVDADNLLLWRFAPRRIEAEAVRDSILAVSGRLNPKRGGPSFQPFTVVVNNSSFYTLVDKDDPELDRRTVYRMNINGARMPLLESLDCPDPSTKTPRRGVTTTALQALELMNSSFVARQSKWFAERIRKEAGEKPAAQVSRIYALAFGRQPTPAEAKDAEQLISRAGLQSLCWAVFNMDEFLYTR